MRVFNAMQMHTIWAQSCIKEKREHAVASSCKNEFISSVSRFATVGVDCYSQASKLTIPIV